MSKPGEPPDMRPEYSIAGAFSSSTVQSSGAKVDPRVPLQNLSAVRARMDSLQQFLYESVNSNTLIAKHQMDMVSSEIASAIHQIIVNGTALLSCTPAAPDPAIPARNPEGKEEDGVLDCANPHLCSNQIHVILRAASSSLSLVLTLYMATSLFSPVTSPNPEVLVAASGLPKSSFLSNSKLFFCTPSVAGPRRQTSPRCCAYSKKSLDHIPKQFRKENLKDGVMENFKNVPQYLYGLSPSQMDMFMTEDNPVRRQSERVTEESISSARNYLDHGGMWSMSGMNERGPSKYSMSVSMYRGGARGYGRPRTAPPDLPSLLLDARICYLGMPIVPAVTELIVAQFMWLDYDNPSKPIYLYINSSGTQNEKMETVGSETEAYAIADTMAYCKADVYTVNCGMAYGQAAMLLSLGTKGYRAVQPNSSTKLYLPKVNRSSGAVIDMWIKAKELDANTEYYIELLAKGTGKTEEEIAKDIQRPKYLQAQEAIDYGIADKIIDSRDVAFEKRDYDGMLAQSKAMRRAAGAGPQAAPSGFR